MEVEKIIVTGANGTISRYLIPRLVASGYDVIGLSRSNLNIQDNLKNYVGDLHDSEFLDKVLENATTIIHTAALTRSADADEFYIANEELTSKLIDSARRMGVKKFIFFSSDLALNPVGPYGASKLACENLVKDSKLNDWVILRLSPFIGGCNNIDNSTFSKLIAKVKKGERIWLPAGGNFHVAPIFEYDLSNLLSTIINTLTEIKQTYTVTGEQLLLSNFLGLASRNVKEPLKIGNVPFSAIRFVLFVLQLFPFIRHPIIESLNTIKRSPMPSTDSLKKDFDFMPTKTSSLLVELLSENQKGTIK